MGCQVRAAEEVRAACLMSTASGLTAAASGPSSPTTTVCPRRKRTRRCTSGASSSERPTAKHAQIELCASLPARLRCVSVQQCETRLTGVVLAAAQGDRLRLHHRRRIRHLRTENEPAHILSKISISEIAPRPNDLNALYHLYQFTTHNWKNEQNPPARTRYYVSTLGRFIHLYF